MHEELVHYRNSFSKLRTDSGKSKYPENSLHKAPHKPLLLLAVLDLAAQGSLTSNMIPLVPELSDLFQTYWKLVMPADRAGNFALPFFHLKNEGFWHLVPLLDKEETLGAIRQIAGMAQLRETVAGAKLDYDLYQLIGLDSARLALRIVLIDQFFHSAMHSLLFEQANINLTAFQYSLELLQKARLQGKMDTIDSQEGQKSIARDQGFRRAIVTAYDHRCVLCGIRLLTEDGLTAATATHIIPWSINHNDDPRNGLCLCRLCHWTFDVGLAGITTKYRVKLSRQLSTTGNMSGYLSTLDSRPIFEPVASSFNPDIDALTWHLNHLFLT